jgi:hypothetical protein
MSPFIPEEELIEIYGGNLLKDNDLLPILKQLKGEVEVKPFECVGTVEEVNACLAVSGQQSAVSISDLLNQYDEMNNLPEQFEAILKDNLFKNN